ncbi:MAG TPA: DHH family phosphoesterase [Candidatus Saccharimonadales bacterium]
MYEEVKNLVADAQNIVIVQAENPDGDSLGSALAFEEILGDLAKNVSLYCPVDIPRYLRYFPGWDRVTNDFNVKADLAIIVDTSADILLSKVLETPGVRAFLETHPVVVVDHHATESTLSFDVTPVYEEAAATSEIILRIANELNWTVNSRAAEHLLGSLLSDTLGLNTQSVTPASYNTAAQLVELGAHPANIEERRREFMKKAPEILEYKGRLIERIEYFLDGKLALVHIPFDEIEKYSDKYNPSMLVLDEMRLVEGVEVACAIKTYPDGKLTGKLRSNSPVSEQIAGFFGGGGHAYAAGFRIYEEYEASVHELVTATEKTLKEQA